MWSKHFECCCSSPASYRSIKVLVCICFGFENVLKVEEREKNVGWQDRFWKTASAFLLPDDGDFGVARWTLVSLRADAGKFFVERECLLSKQSVYGTGSDRLSLSGRELFWNGWHWLVYVPDGSLGLLITRDLKWPHRQSVGGRGSRWVVFLFICLSAPWKKSVSCRRCNAAL